LDNNNAPPEIIIPSLRDFVSLGSARRTHLDAKIAILQAALNKTLEERNPLDIEIRKHQGAISPLRRLPTEILSLIFGFTMPSVGQLDNLLLPDPLGPWALSMVCSHWRAIVLSQPSLW
ncbi:hypothetical protein B0H11DRAFT_1657647, partial [Mycena galericulata]